MTRDDIAAMSRAFAPVIAELLTQATAPLLERVAELEGRLTSFEPPAPIDPAPAVREALAETLPEMVASAVREVVEALPPAEPGKDGAPGKLGAVQPWEDRVFYEAAVVTFEGALYQALRDTGRSPPHEDWLCIVSRGADAEPAPPATEIEVTGTFDETRAYRKLNVVALNGGSFIAKRDDPGPCPGDGWQLVASQGTRGKPGESVKGDPGRPGPAVRSIDIDDEGMLTLINADGTKAQCDLYPLLAKVAST